MGGQQRVRDDFNGRVNISNFRGRSRPIFGRKGIHRHTLQRRERMVFVVLRMLLLLLLVSVLEERRKKRIQLSSPFGVTQAAG